MRLYLTTDMEGVAGVLDHDNWVMRDGCWYKTGVDLLTAETNAAIAGFRAGGFTDIVVMDGHGAGGIDPTALDPDVELLRHAPTPVYPWCLDEGFDAIAWVGQHAKAGTPMSHITHTGWFDVIDLSVNGISIGEYGQFALCAKELGVPCIFAAGEQALCDEATALTPGVETVAVKWGLKTDGLEHLTTDQYRNAKLAARHLSPTEARRRIAAGARRAAEAFVADRGRFRFPELAPPYTLHRVTRGVAGGPITHSEATHPDSLIGVLNAPRHEVAR